MNVLRAMSGLPVQLQRSIAGFVALEIVSIGGVRCCSKRTHAQEDLNPEFVFNSAGSVVPLRCEGNHLDGHVSNSSC